MVLLSDFFMIWILWRWRIWNCSLECISEAENEIEHLTEGIVCHISSFLSRPNLFIPIEILGRMGKYLCRIFNCSTYFFCWVDTVPLVCTCIIFQGLSGKVLIYVFPSDHYLGNHEIFHQYFYRHLHYQLTPVFAFKCHPKWLHWQMDEVYFFQSPFLNERICVGYD